MRLVVFIECSACGGLLLNLFQKVQCVVGSTNVFIVEEYLRYCETVRQTEHVGAFFGMRGETDFRVGNSSLGQSRLGALAVRAVG